MDESEIRHLRIVFNKEHKNPIPDGTPSQIWKEITKRLHSHCSVITKACVLASLMKKTNAPQSWRKNSAEWLSSVDIENVEKEFMKVFESYKCLGTIPIDFDKRSQTGKCIVDSLCSTNLLSLQRKGYTQIGIVFNTDVSTGPGQHWIALFCDIRPELEYTVCTFFDSYANKPEPEIETLMLRWKDQWDSQNQTKMHLEYNSTKHQQENSECGMYCLYFHFCCLADLSMKERIPDAVVRGFRELLFRIKK